MLLVLLKSYHLSSLSVVLNKVRGDLLMSREILTPRDIEELLKTPVCGILPEEYGIYQGDLAEIHAAFKTLAYNVQTGKRKLYDVTKKYSGFFGNIRRVLKKNL